MPEITIHNHAFDVPSPFLPEHVAPPEPHTAENVANALNQLMHENLRNNYAKKVKDALNGSETLAPAKHKELQDSLTEYASTYAFGARAVGQPRVTDPVEKEAIRMAKAIIKQALSAAGSKATAEAITEAAHRYLAGEKGEAVKRDARRTVKAQQEAATDVLGSVGLAA